MATPAPSITTPRQTHHCVVSGWAFGILNVSACNWIIYNNNNTKGHIYSAIICESWLWVLWVQVGQRQVAANSKAKLQTWPLSTPAGCYMLYAKHSPKRHTSLPWAEVTKRRSRKIMYRANSKSRSPCPASPNITENRNGKVITEKAANNKPTICLGNHNSN